MCQTTNVCGRLPCPDHRTRGIVPQSRLARNPQTAWFMLLSMISVRRHDYGTAGRKEERMPTARMNGFDMYYEAAGQGVPLLFVHGGLGGGRGSALFRQHHMPDLAQYAHVIAFDRRAAGLSETPPAGYSFDGFVADIVALLDHLGHERAVLMGHSAGGPQVLQCALTYPERVRALILSSTATQTVNVPPALASLVTFLGTEGLTHLQSMLARSNTAPSGPPVEPLAPL